MVSVVALRPVMDTARKDRMGSEGEADQTHLSSQCAGHPPRPISGAHAPPPRSSPCPVLDTPATRTYSRPRAFHSDGIGYHDGDHHTATASPDARSDDQAGPSSDGPETSLPCCRRSAAAAASPRGPYFSRERWFPLITACLERDAEANTDRFSDFWPGADPSPPAASPPQATASAPDDAATLHARDARLFHGRNVPSIDVADYLDRLFSFFQCSPAALFAALWYIRRVALSDPYLQVTRHTVHRLLLTALMIGAKFLDDRFLSNRFYAEVGGVTLQELNAMEVAMLKRLGWRATVRLRLPARIDSSQHTVRLHALPLLPTLKRSAWAQ